MPDIQDALYSYSHSKTSLPVSEPNTLRIGKILYVLLIMKKYLTRVNFV